MTEQPQTKCSSCGCSIPQNKDDLPNTGLCDRCKNSSETQEWFKRQREKNTPATLEGVKAVFRKWLFIGADDEVIDVIMACAIDRKLSGDPLWLFLISPSGGTKTEIVRSLQNDEDRKSVV